MLPVLIEPRPLYSPPLLQLPLCMSCYLSFCAHVEQCCCSGYFWIYFVGLYLGSLIAAVFYMMLKIYDYETVLLDSDSEDGSKSPEPCFIKMWKSRFNFLSRAQREAVHNQQDDNLAELGAKNASYDSSVKPQGEKPHPHVASLIPSQDTGATSSPMAHKPLDSIVA